MGGSAAIGGILFALVIGVVTPAWAMQILVIIPIPTQGTLTLDVVPSDTTAALKQKLNDRTGIPSDQQVLKFGTRTLADGRTLSDYNVERGSTIRLMNPLRIRPATAPEFTVLAEPNATPRAIATDIQTTTGIAPADQVLWFDGEPLPATVTLRDSGVPFGARLDLNPVPPAPAPSPGRRAARWADLPSSVGVLTQVRVVSDWGDPRAVLTARPAATCLTQGRRVLLRYPGTCRLSLTQRETAGALTSRWVRVTVGSTEGTPLPTRAVRFGPDSPTLGPRAKRRLRGLATRIDNARAVLVSGHSARYPDSRVDARQLSRERANSVTRLLRKRGVSVTATAGYGHRYLKPTAAGSRRAEVSWLR